MPEKKPDCAEYIVAAIRATRPERKGLKPGTSSGRALRFIFSLASQFYNEEEFRQSLATLLDQGRVLLIAAVEKNDKEEGSSIRLQKISVIPPCAPLLKTWWFLDTEGNPVESRRGKVVFTRFFRPCLYIVADGLPERISDFVTSDGMTKAEQIMASLQE